ncbi:cysteine-rich receptor-like protein kinase [Trifolium pratense]|uniref:Cysteine-rich receptor-like protein kinase n=1 Tax=Trifolium pratense TaxID=57577 RepID=A0A2K3L6D6_TRIPR|nr:cysteine-rich receptor-like protein kinase [Trifolium pratense]
MVHQPNSREGRDEDSDSSEEEEGLFPVMEEVEEVEVEREEEEVAVEREKVEENLLALIPHNIANNDLNSVTNYELEGSLLRVDRVGESNNLGIEDNLNLSQSNSRISDGGSGAAKGLKGCKTGDLLGREEGVDGPANFSNTCQETTGGVNSRVNISNGLDLNSSKLNEYGKGGKNEVKGGGNLHGPTAQKNTVATGPRPNIQKQNLEKGCSANMIHRITAAPKSKKIPIPYSSSRKQDQVESSLKIRPINPSKPLGRSISTSSGKEANVNPPSSARSSAAAMETCDRNPVGRYKPLKKMENSLSSAGSILCCSSLKSSDIRNCNQRFMEEHNNEVATKVWQGVTELGVEGDEDEERYVQRIIINEKAEEEARRLRLRGQHNQGAFELCLLQETKRTDFDDYMIFNLWGHNEVDWIAKESRGLSGGLLSIWKRDLFKFRYSFTGTGFLGACIEWKDSLIYIVNIYSPCSMAGKRKLWDELLAFKLNNEKGEWVLGGDFNAILKSGERRGNNGGGVHNERVEFNMFVDCMEVIDVPVAGKKFSWFSGDGQSMSRLDRFLLSEGFIEKGGVSGQWIGNRDISDHCPIWLMCDNIDWGPKPFKFNNCWTEHPDFNSFVTNLWGNLNITGKKAFVIKEKLKKLKEGLRVWNKEIFGILDLNIEKTVNELNELEGMFASRGTVPNSVNSKVINQKFWELLNFKESLIKQKSRVKWIQEGDSNSRFFHASIKGRRRRNQLSILKKGDEWIHGVESIKKEVKDHFSTFFTEEWNNRPFLHGINFNSLSEADNAILLEPFTEEEVKETIWSCDGNKSPGPDGFNFNFLKSCWTTVKSDIMEFLREFYDNAVLPKAITSSFLTLIPKKRSSRIIG